MPLGASLVVQWLTVRLPMQGSWVLSPEPELRGCMLQLVKPTRLQPTLCNKRSHHNEPIPHCNKQYFLLAAASEPWCPAMKT